MPNLSDIVRVTATIASVTPPSREFGRSLFLYNVMDDPDDEDFVVGERLVALAGGIYPSLREVADDFDTDHEVYEMASKFFQMVPYPRPMVVSGRFSAGARDVVIGDNPDTFANIQGIPNPTFAIDGNAPSADPDFSGATDEDGLATALQISLRLASGYSNAVVVYDTDHYRLEFDANTGNFLTGNIAAAFGLDEDNVAVYVGVDNDITAADALNRAADNLDFSWLTLSYEISSDATDATDVAEWAAANGVHLIIDNTQIGTLTTNESTSIAASISSLESAHNTIMWSRTADYKAASLAAAMSSVDFDAPDSLITAKFVRLLGTMSDELTATQKAELDRKRINHYSPYGGVSIVAEGTTCDPSTWIDVRYWLDWYTTTTQGAIFTVLQNGRVPQTLDGVKRLQDSMEAVCETGVLNGGIAPGTVTESIAGDIRRITGNRSFDGFLSVGYLIYIAPLAQQLQTARAARKAPPVNVWLKGSGAIHELDIVATFLD